MSFSRICILIPLTIGFLVSCVKQEAPESAPTVITLEPTDVKLKSFVMSGDVTNEGFNATKERGFVWSSKNSNPSVSDTKLSVGYGKGQYSLLLENLNPNSTYYYKAFATNDKGTSYGETKIVKTADYSLATLTTDLPKNITYTTAELGGNVSDEGGIAVSERGICLAINNTPTIDDIKITNGKGLGSFANIVIRLVEGSNYSVRAYAINGKGTSYGNEQKFSTIAIKSPTVATDIVTSIAATYVTLQGNVTDNGGADLIEKGFCISKNPNPSINDIRVKALNIDVGAYAIVLTALDPQTKYYVRAYAQNSKGISFGNELIFTTSPATIATVGTNDYQEITQNSVRAGVEINNNGGAEIMEFGVCLSTNRNPTIFDRKVILGTINSPGKMDKIAGLTAGTTYYLRGYAINRVGVAYGPERNFTTLSLIAKDLKNNLITYLPFTGNMIDAINSNHSGNIFGASATTDRFGNSNSAFNFKGNDYAIINLSNASVNLSVSFWFTTNSTLNFPLNTSINSQFNIMSFVDDQNRTTDGISAFQFGSYNTLMLNYFHYPYNININNAKIDSNVWHHIVYQRTANYLEVYFDGVLQNRLTVLTNSQNLSDLVVGKQWKSINGLFYNGKIDDIGIWHRILTLEEIKYLYQNNFQP